MEQMQLLHVIAQCIGERDIIILTFRHRGSLGCMLCRFAAKVSFFTSEFSELVLQRLYQI